MMILMTEKRAWEEGQIFRARLFSFGLPVIEALVDEHIETAKRQLDINNWGSEESLDCRCRFLPVIDHG